MRASIEFEVFGSTLNAILNEATKIWQDIADDIEAELPHDAEISMSPDGNSEYRATVFVRLKV